MKIKCHHCGYVWDYKGKKKFYAQCTQCRYQVRLDTDQARLDTVEGTSLRYKAAVKALCDAGFDDLDITLLMPIITKHYDVLEQGTGRGYDPTPWHPITAICFLCKAMRALLPLSKERFDDYIKERAALEPDYNCLLDNKKWCGEDAR